METLCLKTSWGELIVNKSLVVDWRPTTLKLGWLIVKKTLVVEWRHTTLKLVIGGG